MMVKLAVLLATLLLLTGVAFAIDGGIYCECYKIDYTGLDSIYTGFQYYQICLNYEGHSGNSEGCYLSLFFDGLSKQVLASCPGCVASFKFHGHNNNVLTGIEYCETGGRFTMWGHIVDMELCNP